MAGGPSVLVLGPSVDHLSKPWPLQLRRDAVAWLIQGRCPALILEDVDDAPGENAARKFRRICEEHDVSSFAVVWPKACRLNGLDVELGFLLERILSSQLDARDLHLVCHRDNARIAPETGTLELGEKGNRTRYYAALVDEGCTLRLYDSLGHLRHNISAVGVEHLQRHVLRLDEETYIRGESERLTKRQPTPE